MERLQEVLKAYPNAKILDVATGGGGFLEKIAAYAENPLLCEGIDPNSKAIKSAQTRLSQHPFSFQVMDGHQMTYADESFDIVTLSNSLHHMADPVKALNEISRVLRPGGLFVLFEMVKDGQTEKQMTHVLMHHYWAAIDTLCGICHNETYSRAELDALMLHVSELKPLHRFEIVDPEEEANAPSADEKASLESYVTSYLDKLTNTEDASNFKPEAEQLVDRIRSIGFASATECLQVFEKSHF